MTPTDAAALTEALIRETGATAASRILEIGIGTGRISGPLIQCGLHVTGIDLARPMLDVLRQNYGRVPVVIGDAADLPFTDRTVDVVLAFHVLHLTPAWRTVLREVARVVCPGLLRAQHALARPKLGQHAPAAEVAPDDADARGRCVAARYARRRPDRRGPGRDRGTREACAGCAGDADHFGAGGSGPDGRPYLVRHLAGAGRAVPVGIRRTDRVGDAGVRPRCRAGRGVPARLRTLPLVRVNRAVDRYSGCAGRCADVGDVRCPRD
ncbi:MAG: class I SAM-dependent methyltransferase [Anaerolineae bacterium]|nr:MAG: class I SAM-dependent methyltransferase [Anaerolineae bacterium]